MGRRFGAVVGASAALAMVAAAVPAAQAEGGSQRWSADYAHGAPAFSRDVVVSPDGTTVYVTGATEFGSAGHMTTLAYDAATGAEKWTSEYIGRSKAESGQGQSLTISPDGETLFVIGYNACSSRAKCGSYYDGITVVAYAADTGRRRWVERAQDVGPRDLEVTPDGSRLVVYGATGGGYGSATTAYATSDGRQLWTVRKGTDLGGLGGRISLSPDGATVYVAENGTSDEDGCYIASGYRTSAYAVADGDERWTASFQAPGDEVCGVVGDLQVAPDGSTVFVSGYGGGETSPFDASTIAYDARTGAQRWARTDPSISVPYGDVAVRLAVAPRGDVVIANGMQCRDKRCRRAVLATVAYDTRTGERAWLSTYDNGGVVYNSDLAMSPDGSSVFVTGQEHTPCLAGCNTVAVSAPIVSYAVGTGQERWVTSHPDNTGEALAVSRDGASVYLAGTFTGSTATTRTAARALGCTTGTCGYTTARYNTRTGSGTSQDGDAAVHVDGWRGVYDRSALGGSYRSSAERGDTVTFRTPATDSFSWLTRQGPRQGKARVTIDGRRARTVDLYDARSAARSVFFGGLSDKRHTVQIRVLGKKSRAAKDARVAVDGFSYDVGHGLTQETSTAVRFGSWRTIPSAAGGTARMSAARGSSVSFEFTGRSVRWITVAGRSSGRARVVIDGKARTVDLYRRGLPTTAVIPFTDLGHGRHRISITPLSSKDPRSRSKNVIVDAFVVRR